MAVLASLDLDIEGEISKTASGLDDRRKRPRALSGFVRLNGSVTSLYVDLPPKLAETMRRANPG